MPAPPEITELVERFDQYNAKYKSNSYNETQVRREFIDPFFKALGWNVDNTQAYDERYKEVIHEDAVKVGGKTKAPDYSFRIGGVRKFFVEAKLGSEKEMIHRRINATDAEVDRLVYELYELTDEEIAIVEGKSG